MVISDLQLGLIGAGAVAIFAVWGYNAWQERKYRKAATEVFQRLEPESESAEEVPASVDLTAGADEERIEPVLDTNRSIAAPDLSPPDESFADPVMELVLPMHPPAPVGAIRLEALRDLLCAKLSKPAKIIGHDGNGWRILDSRMLSPICDIRVAVQLADRQGPVSEDELKHVADALAAFSRETGSSFDGIAIPAVQRQAQALDAFCASVDMQVAIHLVHLDGGVFPGNKLKGLAEAAGMRLDDDGMFRFCEIDQPPLFTISNLGTSPFARDTITSLTTPGVSFWLDVPRVVDGGLAFDRVVAVAREFADALDGRLVDDQHNALPDNSLAAIRAKIVELQARMTEAALPAGGPRALRLFA